MLFRIIPASAKLPRVTYRRSDASSPLSLMWAALTVLSLVALLGVIAGCARAWEYVAANRYLEAGAYRLVSISLRDELNQVLVVLATGAVVVVGVVFLHSLVRRSLKVLSFEAALASPVVRARRALVELMACALVVTVVGFVVNRFLLGDHLAWPSLLADVGVVAIVSVVAFVRLFPLGAARVANVLRNGRMIRVAGVASLFLIGLVNAGVHASERKVVLDSPNVVVILIDTLRRDHVGVYGYDRNTTPNIDSLAQESVVYTSCYAQAPSTKPSVASIFTSHFPSEHGAVENYSQLGLHEFTIAELLRERGYVTAAFVENPVIRKPFQYDQGFAYWHEDLARVYTGDNDMAAFDGRIVKWIERQQDQPFFLYVHYLDPHGPYDANGSFFESREVSGAPFGSVETAKLTPEHLAGRPEQLAAVIERYDEEIRFVDARLGKLIETFQAQDLMDDLVLVLVSDHGEGFLERGRLQHCYGLYSELTDVPLIIKYGSARREAGQEDGPVQHIDLLPTIADLVGIDISSVVPRGRSLLSGNAEGNDVSIVSEYLRDSTGEPQRALVSDGWKLIHNLESDTVELYNRSGDPGDLREVSDVEPEELQRLMSELAQWVDERGIPVAGEKVESDDETTSLLEALGYL